MPIEHIFKRGVIFLWTTNALMPIAITIMQKWGYKYTDIVHWEKIDDQYEIIEEVGKYFRHPCESLLVGLKGNPNDFKGRLKLNVLPGLIKARREGPQSSKPRIFYNLIKEFYETDFFLEAYAR